MGVEGKPKSKVEVTLGVGIEMLRSGRAGSGSWAGSGDEAFAFFVCAFAGVAGGGGKYGTNSGREESGVGETLLRDICDIETGALLN